MFNWFKKQPPVLSHALPKILPEIDIEEQLNKLEVDVDDQSYFSVMFDKDGYLLFDCACEPGREEELAIVYLALNKGVFAQQLFGAIANLPNNQLKLIEKHLNKKSKESYKNDDMPIVSPLVALQVMSGNNEQSKH